MRHRVKAKLLNRDLDHRKALIRNLSNDLTLHESITTTLRKAKYFRSYFEKLITRAKTGQEFNNVKFMKAKLTTDEAVRKMLTDLGVRFVNRPGGYTRIVKLPNRVGDNAPMARIELTEKPKSKKVKEEKEEKTETVETKKPTEKTTKVSKVKKVAKK